MNPKVSIIVPVYNAEIYIGACIESVLNQTFEDWELILVDDGSKDASGDICDDYSKIDCRIVVYHESHHGVSYSRQKGLDVAKGDFILYIDADDQPNTEQIKKMYDTAVTSNADFIMCDYKELRNESEIIKKQEPSKFDGEDILNEIIEGKLYGALWNKMISRNLISQVDAKFPIKIKMREDLIFLCQILPCASTVAYVPEVLYSYERRNVNALTSNYLDESVEYYRQEIYVNLYLNKLKCLSHHNKQTIENYISTLAYITLKKGLLDKYEWEQSFAPIKEYFLSSKKIGYKRFIVNMALNEMFTLARFIRTIIAK